MFPDEAESIKARQQRWLRPRGGYEREKGCARVLFSTSAPSGELSLKVKDRETTRSEDPESQFWGDLIIEGSPESRQNFRAPIQDHFGTEIS